MWFPVKLFIIRRLLIIAGLPGIFWCGGRDSNPYGLPHAPQTCAYAYSAMTASITYALYLSRWGFVKLKPIMVTLGDYASARACTRYVSADLR